ncbi:MAG TPA: 16S rRNA (cytosine(1402)-N(4))-methyltransferase RsmH [Myxococcales bacterium]|nr:16S rRNA (cytosine(1402)-N(4))-methyltransferase RsmH [Myxococcales bacterium]
MSEFVHQTVLRHEAVTLLAAGPGKTILDGTLGGGGHALALLDAGARVIGLDQDPVALAAATEKLQGRDVVLVHGNFRDARALLDAAGIGEVDGALVDLGVSSPQLDDPARGFSFREGGPLDMRMDTTRGEPLSEKLKEWDLRSLTRIIDSLGEERFARKIAREIHRALEQNKLADTRDLAELVGSSIPRQLWPKNIHPATRTFQALRIAVNDELGALGDFLTQLPRLVVKGGRAVAISFHSLEDRMVKQGFAKLATGCICPPQLPICACGRSAQWKVLTKKPILAGEEELKANPRARSAKLRAVERLA